MKSYGLNKVVVSNTKEGSQATPLLPDNSMISNSVKNSKNTSQDNIQQPARVLRYHERKGTAVLQTQNTKTTFNISGSRDNELAKHCQNLLGGGFQDNTPINEDIESLSSIIDTSAKKKLSRSKKDSKKKDRPPSADTLLA